MSHRVSAIIVAVLLTTGGVLTAIGDPERDVSMTSAGELWSDVFRDADQFGLQLSRVSAAEEMDLGKKIATGMVRSSATSPMWEVYVQAVGRSLVKHVRRKDIQYEFHVIDGSIKNAFALPGGQIFINRGLLESMESEAELAAVLGHEIAHVDARHCVERFQYRLQLEKAGLSDVGELLAIARSIMVAGYAQYQELEADSLGLSYALAEGYDPQGGVDLFGRMFRNSTEFANKAAASAPLEVLARLASGALAEYFRSHPPTPERIRRMTAKTEQYRSKRAGERVYRGVENFRKRVPRSQQEFSGKHVRL